MKLSDDRVKLKKLQEKMQAQALLNKKPTAADPVLKLPELGELKASLPAADQLTPPCMPESEKKVETPAILLPDEQSLLNA